MKLQIKVDKEIFDGGNQEIELTISDEHLENDWWEIRIDGNEYSVSGRELERLFKSFLANR